MKSRFTMLVAVAYGVILCGSAGSPVSAANINISAAQCQAAFPETRDLLVHEKNGVHTGAQVSDEVYVECAVPRSPITAGASVGFYVDGDNLNGASTMCWISSVDYTGAFLGSQAFTTQDAHYDMFVSLPVAQLGTWAYTALTCVLPPFGNGLLRGVTSLQ